MNTSRLVHMKDLFLIGILFCLLLIPFHPIHAQTAVPNATGITLSASTENPVPGQSVTVTAESYSFDINSATLIWTVNGTVVQKGVGLVKYDATAPALGKKTTIDVGAVTPTGARFDRTIVLGSGSMDLIMESDGYTPPFFKGKTPLAFQNTVSIIAMPHLSDGHGGELDPSTLIYQWKKDDGTVLQDQSGYGKQSISLKGGIIPRPFYVIVTATSRDGSQQAQSIIQVAPNASSLLFYKNDPLYGPLFNKALSGTYHIGSEKEIGVIASPYGFNFSPSDIAKDLGLTWLINNYTHTELASNQSITLRAPSDTSGQSNVQLQIQSTSNILQQASAGFSVTFDNTNSSPSIPANF